ncbi:tryptophan RNA-binding attenuation protein [Halalkalibacter lacteus]|uniref:tryptophan RNA-binding attenuation protein n=1 Tax=Halalkalibacter lacteus TaxID=3090663 RepID=UPI002FCC4866
MVITTDDLELVCPNCEGTRRENGLPCKKSTEKGVIILTSQGNTLLHFIKKYTSE